MTEILKPKARTDQTVKNNAQRVLTSKTTGCVKLRIFPTKTELSDRYSRISTSDWFLAAYEDGAL